MKTRLIQPPPPPPPYETFRKMDFLNAGFRKTKANTFSNGCILSTCLTVKVQSWLFMFKAINVALQNNNIKSLGKKTYIYVQSL